MELHTCLWSDVAAFDFASDDFHALQQAFPSLNLVVHDNADSFLAAAASVAWLLTWEFPEAWYASCPNLQTIMTPASGRDWIAADPSSQVEVVHGTFHGPMMAESALSALLYMNHQMPLMLQNHADRAWDRNLQQNSRLLGNQCVVIVGFGRIGQAFGQLIGTTCAEVIGVRRSNPGELDGMQVRTVSDLPEVLPSADHVILVLPGDNSTDHFLTPELIRLCKPGVYLYNFGRGNALTTDTVLEVACDIGGAFLDVTDVEPLPSDSQLWQLPNVMITPHSSCIYQEYKANFVAEVIRHLQSETRS